MSPKRMLPFTCCRPSVHSERAYAYIGKRVSNYWSNLYSTNIESSQKEIGVCFHEGDIEDKVSVQLRLTTL